MSCCRPARCPVRETTVDLGDVSSVVGDEAATPLAQIAEDMRCRLDVGIEDRSSADAAIEPREDEVDAIFDFEPAWTIPAGSAETLGLLFEPEVGWMQRGVDDDRVPRAANRDGQRPWQNP